MENKLFINLNSLLTSFIKCKNLLTCNMPCSRFLWTTLQIVINKFWYLNQQIWAIQGFILNWEVQFDSDKKSQQLTQSLVWKAMCRSDLGMVCSSRFSAVCLRWSNPSFSREGYLDRLLGVRYCISWPANGCLSYTHISYHDNTILMSEIFQMLVTQHDERLKPVQM